MTMKLRDLLGEVFEDAQPVNKHAVIEDVSQYGAVGNSLYNNNILQVAEQLVKIAESAQNHVLGETEGWFDKVSVNRNMKSLTGMVKEFKSTATEYNSLSERLTALYEDMGTILNRYYDISEGDKGDMDGDRIPEPDEEEWKDNRDTAIQQAMK